jgi:HK97 family phage major capsid protein
MNTDLTQALDELTNAALTNVERLNARVDAVETRQNRAMLGGPASEGVRGKSAALKSFEKLMRYGETRLDTDDRRNSVIVSDDGKGGYLAVPEFQTELIRNLVVFSPIRQLARIGTTNAGNVLIPKRLAQGTATWVGETETRSEAQPAFGMEEIPINEAAAYIDISSQMLEDAAIDMAAELGLGLGEEFGRQEGLAGFVGNGVKQPEGVLVNPGVTSVVSGAASSITADSMISMFYDLPAFYRNSSTWAMSGKTLAAVRKLKDGAGSWLWQPSMILDQPELLLGRPVVECVDLPDVASSATPIVLGNWNVGYRLIDRLSLAILRDPFSLATTGKIRFHARRRVGGGVVQAAAFRKMLVSA